MNNSEQKEEIRQRYKGVDKSQIKLIRATEEPKFFDDSTSKRVAVYARVSTGDPHQTTSYELQKNYYEDMVLSHPHWTLVDIYADEGITGTSLRKRTAFNRMIENCYAGMIDLILVKNIARFARNTVDCLQTVRNLGALNNPVGIYFESERIYIRGMGDEMALAFLATMAQEESHSKSVAMNGSIEMRNKAGIVLTPALFGFDLDEKRNLVINEKEAPIVKLIFFMYLFGYSSSEIAEYLTDQKIPTKKGNLTWSSSSVLGVLKNERHCGDILARKTFTPNYLDHKPRKNRGERNQYYIEDHHCAIISREDFLAVQDIISNRKYGYKGFYPTLTVITSGPFSGFVPVNTKWDLFTAQDYTDASLKCPQSEFLPSKSSILSGSNLTRSYFYNIQRRISVTISPNKIVASSYSLECLNCNYVELLIDPVHKILCFRSTTNAKHRINWKLNSSAKAKTIAATAFSPMIYSLMNWDPNYKYKSLGFICSDNALLFYLDDAILIRYQNIPKPIEAFRIDNVSSQYNLKRFMIDSYKKEQTKQHRTPNSHIPSSKSTIKKYIDTLSQ